MRYKTNDRVKFTVAPFRGIEGTITKRTLIHGYVVTVHNGIKVTNVRSWQIAKVK